MSCDSIYIPISNCDDCGALLSRITKLESTIESMAETITEMQSSGITWDDVNRVPISITDENGTTESVNVLAEKE